MLLDTSKYIFSARNFNGIAIGVLNVDINHKARNNFINDTLGYLHSMVVSYNYCR